MNRSTLRSWIVVIAGLILAITVFVLLITGVFTLTNLPTFYISEFALAALNLLALEASFLAFRQHKEAWRAVRPYLRLALVGTVGLLVDLLLALFFGAALEVLLMVAIAIDFFFLALLLGGDAMLITEFARWHLVQTCED